MLALLENPKGNQIMKDALDIEVIVSTRVYTID